MEVVKAHPLFTPGSEGLLSPLLSFFKDSLVSEILINKPKEVFIERAGIMTRFDMPMLDSTHLRRLFTFIANENRLSLNEDKPILSGNIFDGSRVQLVIPPASRFPTLSIRRPSILKRTLEDYKSSGFYDETRAFYMENEDDIECVEERELITLHQARQWGDFIAHAIALKKNIVIAGETSSGKTTYLNACIDHIPASERIITLEDTFEVDIPHQNVVSLRAPKKGEEDKTGLCMQDLVQCALRLRPDRLIMGEIRGPEVLDFINAASTGHKGTITSFHAGNPRQVFRRMTQLYKLNNVPSMRDEDIRQELNEVIDIIVQVTKSASGRISESIYYKNAKRPT